MSGSHAEPVEIGLTPGEHLTVLGNSGSGRSGLLRAVASAAHQGGGRLWLVAPRRSLESTAIGCHRRASDPSDVGRLLEELTVVLLEGPAAAQRGALLRAAHVLVIDDLDLMARSAAAPLTALAELLPFAADVGLSVVAARRASGSNRASFDPFFGRLLELCDTGILLSGDPGEGPVLGGLRPRPRPPGRGELVLRGEPAGELHVASLEVADTGAQRRPSGHVLVQPPQRVHPKGWM